MMVMFTIKVGRYLISYISTDFSELRLHRRTESLLYITITDEMPSISQVEQDGIVQLHKQK